MNINQYKNIKPLVIGIGVAGKRHLEAQLNLGIKIGAYTTNPQTAKSLRGQNDVIVFDNLDDAIDWSNLVHVCTPDDKHTEFVAKAVQKRKAVLCEKSFTTSLKDALYLQSLAHKYESTLIIGQNYRLTPTFAETRKQILKGLIGTITKIEITYLHDKSDYQKRYSDKNFLYIGGSHVVDLANWIIGEEIVIVEATSTNPLNYQIVVKFTSGILGDIRLDANSSQLRNGTDLIVYGAKGKLVSHNKVDLLSFYPKGNKNSQNTSLPNNETYTTNLEVKIVDDFVSGRSTFHWPLPNVDEAINTMKVLDMVEKSVSSGKSESI